MEANKVLMGIALGIVIVLVVSIIQTFEISSIKREISRVTGSVTKQIDTSGFTENEKMNYEMHGTIPTRYQTSSGSTNPQTQMVGGC